MQKFVFVFGSNLRGVHGAGAAKHALIHYGAVYGQGIGHYGDSYALPTKDWAICSLPIQQIKMHVEDFIEYAKKNPTLLFKVTQIGCGLAGFKPEQIAPLFEAAPDNCYFDPEWKEYLPYHCSW